MWRQFSIEDPDAGHRLLVADLYGDRDILASKIIFNMLHPFLWVSPLLAVLIWFGVGAWTGAAETSRHRYPESRLQLPQPGQHARCGRRRSPPWCASSTPSSHASTTPTCVVSRFTSDAAHELRTPLAGIRAQATVALRSPDKAGREHALRQVLKGSDRAAHLVKQMLLLARVDPNAIATSFKPIELRQAASEVVDEMRSKATEQGARTAAGGATISQCAWRSRTHEVAAGQPDRQCHRSHPLRGADPGPPGAAAKPGST